MQKDDHDAGSIDAVAESDEGNHREDRKPVLVSYEELETLTSSAIADIHAEVDEVFADGLRRVRGKNWTAEALKEKRQDIFATFIRAIELCEVLEGRSEEAKE